MTREDRRRWDDRYHEDARWQDERRPFDWLTDHAPPNDHDGIALDLACGLGHDAIWLAGQGYRVIAVDGSRVALERGLAAARHAGTASRIIFTQADLDAFRPPPNRFDLVCVIRFLDRDLFAWLEVALKPGGLLVYATLNWRWMETRPDTEPHFLLQPEELLSAFPRLHVVDHKEEDFISAVCARK